MRKPDDNARKSQAQRLLKEQKKDDANLVTLANKVVEGVHAFSKLKEKTLKSKGKKLVKRELDPKEGITISHEEIPSSHPNKKAIDIFAHDRHGNQIGRGTAEYKKHPQSKHAEMLDIEVKPEHRRKGVATAMYQHAEKVTGRELKPSGDRTTSGTAFWQGTRMYGPTGHGPFGAHTQRIRKEELEKAAFRHFNAEFHGWISPKGGYHPVERKGSHAAAAYQHIETHYPETSPSSIESKPGGGWNRFLHDKGWIAVGGGGEKVAEGNTSVLHDKSHPATRKLTELVSKHPNTKEPLRVYQMDVSEGHQPKHYEVPHHLAEKGHFHKPSETQMYRSVDEKLEILKDALQGLEKTDDACVRVLLIRHGKTIYNDPDKTKERLRGWLNVPLDDRGRKEAEEAADIVGLFHIDCIYASSLKRCGETAAIIIKKLDLPLTVMDDWKFRPWHLGELQGQIVADIADKLKHYQDNHNEIPPGGESFMEFKTRYIGGLKDMMERALKERITVAIATHYRNLKVAEAWIAAGMTEHDLDADIIDCDDLTTGDVLELYYDNGWKTRRLKHEENLEKEMIGLTPEEEKRIKGFHGWISPEGQYHQMEPEETHRDAADIHAGHTQGNAFEQLHQKGWLSVGRAGRQSIQGHHDVLSDPSHPATKKAAKLVSKLSHFGSDAIEIFSHSGGLYYKDRHDIVRHGHFGRPSKVAEFHKTESDQLHLEHYSSHDIEEVHPKFHGVGVPGEESKRKQDSDWVDRSYHYVAGTKPEAALGQKRYKYHSTVPKDKIYDMGKDPKGFTKDPTDEKGYRSHNVVERRIKDAGYLGYRHSGSAMPNVVAMFHPVKPHTKEDRQIEKVGLVGPRSHRKLGGEKGITGFSIISEENPKHEVTAKGPLEQHLKEAGYVYHKMAGKYSGKKENSYIVHNARSKHIEDLGRVYGQESVIHSTGQKHQMVYVNGPKAGQHHKGEGIQFHDKEPADNYSTLGNRHFSLNFDYEKLHKSEQVSQPGGSPIYDAGSARLHCETCQQKTYHTGHRQNQKERGTVWFHACAECGTEKPWIRKSEELEKTVMQGGQKEFHGWIDHEGTYHHMKPHEEHGDFEGASYDQGWLAVGVAGYANVQGKQKFLENPHHPATQTARKLVGEHFPDKNVDLHVMHEKGTKPGLNQTTHTVNGAHWAKHGTIPKSKVAEFHKAATMSVAVDFDGTIVENKFPEIGNLKPGAIEALQALKSKGYKILIYSARSSTPEGNAGEMKTFLDKNQVPYDEIYSGTGKPIASAYIDDKAIEFKDNWQQIVDRVLMSGVKHRLEVLKSLVEKK